MKSVLTAIVGAALGMAATSGTVFIIGADHAHCKQLIAQLMRLDEYKAIPHAKVDIINMEVSLWPQGQIRFRSKNDPAWDDKQRRLRGYPPGLPVLIDSHTYETE